MTSPMSYAVDGKQHIAFAQSALFVFALPQAMQFC